MNETRWYRREPRVGTRMAVYPAGGWKRDTGPLGPDEVAPAGGWEYQARSDEGTYTMALAKQHPYKVMRQAEGRWKDAKAA